MLKRIGLIIAIVFIIGTALYLIPWRVNVNTTITGIQCRIGNNNDTENISLMIKGVYKNYLFKNDTFHGNIFIDKYNFTSNSSELSLYFNDGWSSLSYFNLKSGILDVNTLGTIICTPEFKKVLICISEPLNQDSRSWSSKNGLFISAPAKNRNQAINNAKDLSNRSKWLSKAKWY